MQEQIVQGVEAVQLGGNAPDFSIMGMFLQADFIVQAVMIMLLTASLWSWSIIFNTWTRLKEARGQANDF